jgi:hypothetical protein
MIDYNDLYRKYSSHYVEAPDKSYNNILSMGRVNMDPRPYQHIMAKLGMPGMVQPNVYQLESWQDQGKPVVSRTGRKLGFPRYNEALIKKGLTYSLGRSRRNSAGFVNVYRLLNRSRVGAIIETAGRANFNGDRNSQSNNPNAGAHFNRAIQGTYGGFKSIGSRRTDKGRLLFAAFSKDQGQVTNATFKAINTAVAKFNSSTKRRIGLAA